MLDTLTYRGDGAPSFFQFKRCYFCTPFAGRTDEQCEAQRVLGSLTLMNQRKIKPVKSKSRMKGRAKRVQQARADIQDPTLSLVDDRGGGRNPGGKGRVRHELLLLNGLGRAPQSLEWGAARVLGWRRPLPLRDLQPRLSLRAGAAADVLPRSRVLSGVPHRPKRTR